MLAAAGWDERSSPAPGGCYADVSDVWQQGAVVAGVACRATS